VTQLPAFACLCFLNPTRLCAHNGSWTSVGSVVHTYTLIDPPPLPHPLPPGRSGSSGARTLSTWQAAWSTKSTSAWRHWTRVSQHADRACTGAALYWEGTRAACVWGGVHAAAFLLLLCLVYLPPTLPPPPLPSSSCCCFSNPPPPHTHTHPPTPTHPHTCVLCLCPSERVSRVEMETKTVRQVGQDLLRLQDKLDNERSVR
jgi:hypothetical protein